MKNVFSLICALMMTVACCYAQETSCSDGIDNDGDGYIDCFDGDCSLNAVCETSYIGYDRLCQTPPTTPVQFQMQYAMGSQDQTSLSYGRFAVGDLDADGYPEVVTTHRENQRLFILRGTDLSVKYNVPTTGLPEWFDLAIGNINRNDCARIFIAEERNGGYFITSFDCTGTQLWSVPASGRPNTLGLADFDHDGLVELYYRNEILDAHTGTRLVAGTGSWGTSVDAGPVAVDILDNGACTECAGLELVVGGLIYAVDLSPRTANGNTLGAPVRNVNTIAGTNYFPRYTAFAYVNSQTSIADFNLDGHLDVLMNGGDGPNAASNTMVFFWDVHNNTVLKYAPRQADNTSWNNGAGRLNVADIDGNGSLDVTFVSGRRLYALDQNFNLKWTRAINEATSGFTSTTVFDFNNDGAVEVVYRDEQFLYIIDGNTGNAFTQTPCKSRTSNEYPVVVDVNGDGATEICVTCNTSDLANVDDAFQTRFGHLRVYESALQPWVPARKVWNQHAYFNVNVNDDLSIPLVQQRHHVVFSQNICGPGENRALNSFLNQSAILDSKGCSTYPAPDVSFVPGSVSVTPPVCAAQNFTVSFSIQNTGEVTIDGTIPITFYDGDPRAVGAIKLNTVLLPVTSFGRNEVTVANNLLVSGTGRSFTLYAVLNDSGTGTIPVVLPNTSLMECNYDNNIITIDVIPASFPLQSIVSDHVQCNTTAQPNGTAQVFRSVGATQQTSGYTFYWFNGSVAGDSSLAVYEGPVRNQLAPGTYTVFAAHSLYRCTSDPLQVTISQTTRTISANIVVEHPYTNCLTPDGVLHAVPTQGSASDYQFEWFEGTVFGTSQVLSINERLSGVEGSTYSVLVTELLTGCETIASETVPDQTTRPVVAVNVTDPGCFPANSGSASASVNGVTSGYTFRWYNGNGVQPSVNFTGANYAQLVAGNYTVVAVDNITGCASNPVLANLVSAQAVSVTPTITSHVTSCALPNGAATALVNGTTSGYSFRWYSGISTQPAQQVATSASVSGLAAGTYTVEAISQATGCASTAQITLLQQQVTPSLMASVLSHQTNCQPPNGSVQVIALGGGNAYNYYWFEGDVTSPDTTQAAFNGAVYTARPAGFYTVIAAARTSRCTSTRQVVSILNNTTLPVIATAVQSQTACLPALSNGGVSATADGVTNGYSFRWFAGADTAQFLTSGSAIANRPSGAVTVKATRTVNGCFSTTTVFIPSSAAAPVLSLQPTDNTHCVNFNGSVTAQLVSNQNAQPGHAFSFAWRRNGVAVTGQNNASLSGVNAGLYEAVVTNVTLGCVSAPASTQINDVLQFPVLALNSSSSTNCDPTLRNGYAEVVTVNAQAVAGLTGFSYQWHTGITATNPINVSSNASADDPRLQSVQGGPAANFTVVVTDGTTGCSQTGTVLVGDARALPVLTFQLNPNTICDPLLTPSPNDNFNGSITVNILNLVGSIADYQFNFGGGATTGMQVGNVYQQLNGGAVPYQVSAMHVPTGCSSLVMPVLVSNNFDTPDIGTTVTASTNCAVGKENGSATVVTVDGAANFSGNYSFQWTGPAAFPVASNPTNQDAALLHIQGGAGYNYNVQVVNTATGCLANALVNVPDTRSNPQLQLSQTPNDVCDLALATNNPGNSYHGTVTALITNIGAHAMSEYIFQWSTGVTQAGMNALSGLSGGSYSVTATHDDTGCTSSLYQITVDDTFTLPTFGLQSTASQNCAGGTPDGSIGVINLTGGTTYAFRWYDGPLASGTVQSTNQTYVNVQGGMNGPSPYEYTVQVIITESGCNAVMTGAVNDDSQLPVINAATMISPNTHCNASKNGSAHVTDLWYRGSQVMNFGDYTFSWSNGASTETLSGVSAGTYTVTATNTEDNCVSSPIQVTVTETLHDPVVNVAEVPQSSCDINLPNGRLTASVNENAPGGPGGGTNVVTGYDFAWIDRGYPFGSASANLGTNNVVSSLRGNRYYEVSVTNTTTGCASVQTHLLTENITEPNVSLGNMLPQTQCTTPNGSVEATLLNPDPNATTPSYTFFWLKEQLGQTTTITANLIADVQAPTHPMNRQQTTGVPSDVLSNVSYGRYSVVVRDEFTHCDSQPMFIDVQDQTFTDFDIVTYGNLPTSCGDLGTIQILVSANAGVTGTDPFTIEIYAGGVDATDPTRPIDYYSNPPNPPVFQAPGVPTETLTNVQDGVQVETGNLPTGIYTITVEDTRGCRDFTTYYLPYSSAPGIDANLVNVTSCNTDNGSLALRAIFPNTGLASNETNYQYAIFRGGSALDPADLVATPFTYGTPSTEDCAANTPGDADGDGFISTVDPDCGGYTPAVTGLEPGFYLLQVIDTRSPGCPAYQSIEIQNIARPAQVEINTITGNSSCSPSPADGSISIDIVDDPLDGVTTETYSIDITPDPGAGDPGAVGATPLTNYQITGLAPIAYSISVTSSNGCTTLRNVTVPDEPVVPSLTVGVTHAQYCDPLLEQSAAIVVNQVQHPGGLPDAIIDYHFDWYTDAPLTTNILSANGNMAINTGGDELANQDAANADGTVPAGTVTSGDYYVVGRKIGHSALASGEGCSSAPLQINIEDHHVVPTLGVSTTADTGCNNSFEGSITVNASAASGPGVGALYGYNWTPSGLSGQPSNTTGNSGVGNLIANVDNGTYSLQVVNATTACTANVSVNVPVGTPPVTTIDASAVPRTLCNSFDGGITNVQVSVNGGPVSNNDFDFVWFNADFTNVLLDGTNPALTDHQLTLANYPAITTGSYNVRAIRKSGGAGINCQSTPLLLTIEDDRVYPGVNIQSTPSSACDSNHDGALNVSATGAASFNFSWISVPAAATISGANGIASPYNTVPADIVAPGPYTVRVTNPLTQCFTQASTTVLQQFVSLAINQVTHAPVTLCSTPANGSASVTAVSTGNTNQFTYAWDDASDFATPLATNDPTGVRSNLGAGDYYVRATRNPVVAPVVRGASASGCITAPLMFSIEDARVLPDVILTTSPSTSCDNVYDGSITVQSSTASGPGVGSNYSIAWLSDPDNAGSQFIVSGNPNATGTYQTPSTDLVGPGQYSVRVTNLVTSCFSDAAVEVSQSYVPIQVLSAQTTPLQSCISPDGTASVSIADVRVQGQSVASGITFSWQDLAGVGLGNASAIGQLATGNYSVSANRVSGFSPASGCVSSPYSVLVEDARQYPQLQFESTPSTVCDQNYDGSIHVNAVTVGLASSSSYNYHWISTPGGNVAVADVANGSGSYTTSNADIIGPGSYQLQVTNVMTGCTNSGSITVNSQIPVLSILNANKNDQYDCAPPDGSISIDPNAGVSMAGSYVFTWTNSQGVVSSPLNNSIDQLAHGTYSVSGVKTGGQGSGCSTGPLVVTVEDKTQVPIISTSVQADVACNSNHNGRIDVSVSEGGVSSTQGYGFNVFTSQPHTLIASTATATPLAFGSYDIEVTDASSPGLGCTNTTTVIVPFTPTELTATVSTVPQNLCQSSANGNATVLAITQTIDGAIEEPDLSLPVQQNRFAFQWFDNALSPLTPMTAGQLTLGNRVAGDYYLVVQNDLGCSSTPIAFTIDDQTAYPDVTLDDFVNPAICVLPPVTGTLQVSADGNLNFSDYTFAWYAGDINGTLVLPDNPTLSGILYNDPLSYVVRVTNKATQCFTDVTFDFDVQQSPIRVIASAAPLTNCVVNDGQLFATVPDGAGALYQYEWYAGNSVAGQPLFSQKNVLTAPLGVFTVIAKDPSFPSCESIPATVEVMDERVYPDVTVETISPMTHCDVTKADGIARATVGGDFSSFQFDWFRSSNSLVPFYVGVEASGLAAGSYTVVGTHVISGCSAGKAFQMTAQPLTVPPALVNVLSHVTNCEFPNGKLQAMVQGNLANYEIRWSLGQSSAVVHTGEYYSDVDVGNYVVRLYDLTSGCESPPVDRDVLSEQVLPEFHVVATKTACELSIGTAEVIIDNDVDIQRIEWELGGATEFGSSVSSLPEGVFTVTAVTQEQCRATESFEIVPDILVFNGVSQNGDGKNDFMEIACIQNFPNNNVKIFNRMGTLVYSARGYNNQDIVFRGISNEGLSLLGRELPDGTYFYIVDKGDGSVALTGYLELMREIR